MKIVWKIFELSEISINDQFDQMDKTISVLSECFDMEFESEEGAILFLDRNSHEFNSREGLVIHKVISMG